jgi:hypothetical protein
MGQKITVMGQKIIAKASKWDKKSKNSQQTTKKGLLKIKSLRYIVGHN